MSRLQKWLNALLLKIIHVTHVVGVENDFIKRKFCVNEFKRVFREFVWDKNALKHIRIIFGENGTR
jgi:hypothetical protein